MKKGLTIGVIVMLASFNSFAGDFLIQNHLGINCLQHTLGEGETFYNVAQKYFVRPSTLAVVNNIDNVESLSEGRTLYIPLTETNFYKTKGLEGSKFIFKPVYYQLQNESKFSELADLFFVSIESLKDWNTQSMPLRPKDKLIVGWVKYEKDLDNGKTPLFVQKEKIIYGNTEEKEEARKELKELKKRSNETAFPNYSVPKDVLPDTKTKNNVLSSTNAPQAEKQQTDTEPKKVESKEGNIRTKSVTKKESAEKTVVELTKEEKEYLTQGDKEGKTKKKRRLGNKIRQLTQNSYTRKKNKNRTEVKPPVSNQSAIKLTKEKKNAQSEKQTTERNKNKIAASTESARAEPMDSTSSEHTYESLVLENKLMRLTFLRSLKGKAAIFYSGKGGVTFYVFTNLANKGAIVKLTNLDNGKYILAKVIGQLSEDDRKKGYIISLSDNARKLLDVKSKSFNAKVNY